MKTSGAGLAGLAITSCGGKAGSSSTNLSLNTGVFNRPFNTPPELLGTIDPATGNKVFNLSMQTGTQRFTGGGVTNTMGINGSYLGPTLRVTQGDVLNLNVTNQIGQETTLHWHGMRPPSDMDGGPHQIIAPNTTWNAAYTVNQQASTNWYHPHPHGTTARQVYAGLAGMMIVDDAVSAGLSLPSTYGKDDFPVVVQDRDMNADGTFAYSVTNMEIQQGKKGNTLLVNGVIDPVLDVPAKEVRFRLLNGSNSRIYTFQLGGGIVFKQIATEQGLLSTPVSLTSITMSPGERAEIVVDFAGLVGQGILFQDAGTGISLFKANVVANTLAVTTTPTTLATLTPLQRNQAVGTRQFILSMGQGKVYINNKQMNINVIDETMVLNDIEILDIQNTSNMDHNFHIHGAFFQLLTRDSGLPKAYETGLKDTVYLPANSRVEAIVQYSQATVAGAPYMYHCHILEHEDAGMMGQFTVA
ncbi:multicopper oxidase family protein [Ghiorsea bivora]|uniref:multicopper oxidase family protein n=1 Tax=Ghiorsea bivora TaxID=1485545 RepID=UPI0018E06E01|nr:multicopper oxidase domain-containing protein [Ghiorsea bivora]